MLGRFEEIPQVEVSSDRAEGFRFEPLKAVSGFVAHADFPANLARHFLMAPIVLTCTLLKRSCQFVVLV